VNGEFDFSIWRKSHDFGENIWIVTYHRNISQLRLSFGFGLDISQVSLCTLYDVLHCLNGLEKWWSSTCFRLIDLNFSHAMESKSYLLSATVYVCIILR